MGEGTFPALDTHELAWAAGFIDGEGHIRAKLQRQGVHTYCYPTMSANQVDPRVLERLHLAVGRLGKVSGPYDRTRYRSTGQPQWCYEVFSFERAQAVIALLWKWLSPVKREQARAALIKVKEHPRPEPRIPPACSIDGCGEPHRARGWCSPHYYDLWQRTRARPMPAPRQCEGCGREFRPSRKARKYCSSTCRESARRQRNGIGELRRGAAHYCAKLTDDDVRAIRAAAANGEPKASIARRFNVTHSNIRHIVARKSWRHVAA